MFDLEKREKFILLTLLAILLIGIALGLYQKRAVRVDVKSSNFTYSEEDPSTCDIDPRGLCTVLININESDAAGLMKLKGVGKVLASRIIEYRSTNGNFRSAEEIKKVKGVGDKLFERIRDNISIE